MAGFLFLRETVDGAPAEPPTFATAGPNWRAGDTISLGHRTLRVVGTRDDDDDSRRCSSLRTPDGPAPSRSTRPWRFSATRCRGRQQRAEVEQAGRLHPQKPAGDG
jgi:hypothetical protein